MDLERLFDLASKLVLPGWLLLVFLPRWRWTQTITAGLVPGVLGVMYLALFISYFHHVAEGFAAFGTLAGVKAALSIEGMLLAGWIHYLAFDLFVGSWEVCDAQRVGVHHLLVIPCLGLTLMMGPVGLLLYLILRVVVARRIRIPAEFPSAATE